MKAATLELLDLQGRKVWGSAIQLTDSEAEVPVADLPAGLYLVRLASSQGAMVQRLVVE